MKIVFREIIYVIYIIGFILVFKVKAYGQTSYELQCKAQAKEVALQTYQTCITENRQAQIESVRKEYQQKLNELKNHYNKELQKAGGKEIKESHPSEETDGATINLRASGKKSAKIRKGEKPTKGIAKVLPRKQQNNGPALPAQIVNDEPPVIPVPTYDESIEKEAAQLDSDSNLEIADPSVH